MSGARALAGSRFLFRGSVLHFRPVVARARRELCAACHELMRRRRHRRVMRFICAPPPEHLNNLPNRVNTSPAVSTSSSPSSFAFRVVCNANTFRMQKENTRWIERVVSWREGGAHYKPDNRRLFQVLRHLLVIASPFYTAGCPPFTMSYRISSCGFMARSRVFR